MKEEYGIEVKFLDSYGSMSGSGMGQSYNHVIVFEVQYEDIIFEARGYVYTDRDTGNTEVRIVENFEDPEQDISAYFMV